MIYFVSFSHYYLLSIESSTLSILKQLRVGSTGFSDFRDKVWNEMTGSNRMKPIFTSFIITSKLVKILYDTH